MNYGEMRDLFHGYLNRSDCDDTLADQFITMGIRRTERLLRTQLQKHTVRTPVDENWPGYLTVPDDYLGMVELAVDGNPIRRMSHKQSDLLSGYYMKNGALYFDPEVNEGEEITLEYYREFPDRLWDDEVTYASGVIPDIIIFGALSYAGTYFVDERKGEWSKAFNSMTQEFQMMSDIDAIDGSQTITPYGGGIA